MLIGKVNFGMRRIVSRKGEKQSRIVVEYNKPCKHNRNRSIGHFIDIPLCNVNLLCDKNEYLDASWNKLVKFLGSKVFSL